MNFVLTDPEADYIFNLLRTRPIGEALPLFEKMREQAVRQQQRDAVPDQPPEPVPLRQ